MINWLLRYGPESSCAEVERDKIRGLLILRERHVVKDNVHTRSIRSSINDWHVEDILDVVDAKNFLVELHVQMMPSVGISRQPKQAILRRMPL